MFLSFPLFIICSFLHYCSQLWPVDKHISLMFLNTVRFLVFIAVYFFISPPTGFNITPGRENLTQLVGSFYTEPDLFYVCVWILRPFNAFCDHFQFVLFYFWDRACTLFRHIALSFAIVLGFSQRPLAQTFVQYGAFL